MGTHASQQLHSGPQRHTLTCALGAQPHQGGGQEGSKASGGWHSYGGKGKKLGKRFIYSKQETHPTRPGNLALAPEWGLCMLPLPSHPREWVLRGEAAAQCPWPSLRGHPATCQGSGRSPPAQRSLPPPHPHYMWRPIPKPKLHREDRGAKPCPRRWISRSPCLRPKCISKKGSCQSHATRPLTPAEK